MKINKFKRLGAAALTAMMVLSTGMTALADTTPTAEGDVKKGYLTISGTTNNNGGTEISKDGATFSIYEVLTFNADRAVDNAQGDYVYTDIKVADAYKGVITEDELKKLPGYGTSNLSSSEIAELAGKLAGVSNNAVGTYVIGQSSAVELPYGYYLLMETGRGKDDTSIKSRPILVAVPQTDGKGIDSSSPVAVTVKSEIPDIKKEVTNGNPQTSNGQENAYNTLQIGDSVDYKVTSAIPMYGSDVQDVTYVITDTLSDGLDFDENKPLTVNVSGGSESETIDSQTLNRVVVVSGRTITIDMSSLFNDANFTVGGKTLKKWGEEDNAQFILTYSAVINDNAVVGNGGNPNTVKLEFEKDHETAEKVVKTYATSLKVIKKAEGAADGAGGLKGAIFKLMMKEGETFVEMGDVDAADPTKISPLTKTTDDNGELTFNGLKAGTYRLIETQAPAGYNKDATEREFTIGLDGSVKWEASGEKDIVLVNIKDNNNEATGTFETTITNVKGLVLPGTGGMGTTIFKIAGAALVILACGMLLVYYKKKNKEIK